MAKMQLKRVKSNLWKSNIPSELILMTLMILSKVGPGVVGEEKRVKNDRVT